MAGPHLVAGSLNPSCRILHKDLRKMRQMVNRLILNEIVRYSESVLQYGSEQMNDSFFQNQSPN